MTPRTDAAPRLDTVIAVDWSAASSPVLGADSIWLARARATAPDRVALTNPATRAEAMALLADWLAEERAAGRRVLAGFDFPFGYPRRAAQALAGAPSWAAVWALLAERLTDGPKNANNRFEVAAALNRDAFDGLGPFWGRPPSRDVLGLPARKPNGYGARYPAERRFCETHAPRAQPTWKLFTTGSVGSQAMMGMAALERLRRCPNLGPDIAVWPYETRFAERLTAPIVIAEIYPSLLTPDPREAVKDAGQVRAVATAFADAADLNRLLRPRASLGAAEQMVILAEEGWIVGL